MSNYRTEDYLGSREERDDFFRDIALQRQRQKASRSWGSRLDRTKRRFWRWLAHFQHVLYFAGCGLFGTLAIVDYVQRTYRAGVLTPIHILLALLMLALFDVTAPGRKYPGEEEK